MAEALEIPSDGMAPQTPDYRSVWTHMHRVEFRQGWIDAGGIRTRYVEAGAPDAPVLIMLHGTASSWEAFCATIPDHAAHFRCFAIDLVGSGYSSKPDKDYEIADYVAHVRDFMQAKEIARASFIGVSLGAWIICRLAVDFPKLVDKLVLIAASGMMSNIETMGRIRGVRTASVENPSWTNIKNIFQSLIHQEADRLDDLISVRQSVYRQPEMKMAMSHILCLQDPEIRARNLLSDEEWKSITAPTLIICAPDDTEVFYQTSQRAAQLMPNARSLEIRGVKHWAHFERPDLFNPVSISFLKNAGKHPA